MSNKYHKQLQKMNAASAGPGRKRPHKPCMILAVIELIEAKKISRNEIAYTDLLFSRYRAYFDLVKAGNDTLNPWLPFFHLRSEPFWHLVPQLGRTDVLEAMNTATKRSDIEKNIRCARLDDELFELLQNPMERDLLRDALLLHWFPDMMQKINDHIGLTELELLLQNDSKSEDVVRSPVRSTAFRRLVTEAYDYRCAATGWRILLPDFSCLVEAAHLIPFSETNDDRPQNGMALTPTFHRALDRNLIAPGPDLKWHVSKEVDRVPDNQPLLELEGVALRLPRDARYQPDQEALHWRIEHLI